MKIVPIPCLEDNYAYLIIDESSGEAAVVDPVEPEKVLKVANDDGVSTVKVVLTTHHHWDHARGNEKMRELVPGARVLEGSLDNVHGCTDKLEHGDKISLGRNVNILALHTPWYLTQNKSLRERFNKVTQLMYMYNISSHTKGHISCFVTGKEEEDPAVFTGDTLYTEKNLRFALTVEPENEHVKQKLLLAKYQREANQPTVPSTIEEEMNINPFMRVDMTEVQRRVGRSSAVEALMEVRRMKDDWTG